MYSESLRNRLEIERNPDTMHNTNAVSDPHTIAVIGLGYVGLPLAVAFSRHYTVLGYDASERRIAELSRGEDFTREVDEGEIRDALGSGLRFVLEPEGLAECDLFVVAVPTPIDAHKQPDLSPLVAASRTVGSVMKRGAIVVFESTVYPGATEEVCVPELQRASGMKYNNDFFCGYSPERINPGDRVHTLETIVKITSGSTPEVAEVVDRLYQSIVSAGTCAVSSIRVAEAAKVIENSQRDINIAFVNELAIIFERMGIDTTEVLRAAGTKWNFLPFTPGLVGGHCIGVDPYYLTHKAESLGYNPQIILAGRRLNDGMGEYIASRVVKLMIRRGKTIHNARVLVLGITFKENCPDIRNSRVVDVVRELAEFGCRVSVYDPLADAGDVQREYHLSLIDDIDTESPWDAVILAVAHQEFQTVPVQRFRDSGAVLFDVKSFFPPDSVDARL